MDSILTRNRNYYRSQESEIILTQLKRLQAIEWIQTHGSRIKSMIHMASLQQLNELWFVIPYRDVGLPFPDNQDWIQVFSNFIQSTFVKFIITHDVEQSQVDVCVRLNITVSDSSSSS